MVEQVEDAAARLVVKFISRYSWDAKPKYGTATATGA